MVYVNGLKLELMISHDIQMNDGCSNEYIQLRDTKFDQSESSILQLLIFPRT